MTESINLSVDLPVSPERVYRAWLDGYEHSQFTGSTTMIDSRPGGAFTARDGYVKGKILVMTPFSHIVQDWRTGDFPSESPDSRVDIKLEPTCLGAQLTLTQTGIPDGHARQSMGDWVEHYFKPMLGYFEEMTGDSAVDMDG